MRSSQVYMEILGLVYLPWWSLIILLPVCLVVSVYIYVIWTRSLFKRLGIPGPEPGRMGILPELGKKVNMNKLTSCIIVLGIIQNGIVGLDPELMNKYGRIVGAFHGRRPTLFISDPDLIKEIFVKDFNSYPHRTSLLPADDMLKISMPNIQNVDHWRFTRSVLSPAFTSGKLREMVPLIQRCIDSLVRNFESVSKSEKNIDVKKLFAAYTMDVIASTGFGMEVDSQNDPDDPFVKNAKQAVNFSFKSHVLLLSLMLPFTVPIMEWLKIQHVPPVSVKEFFSSVCRQALKERRKESSKRRDFLQLALNAHKEKSGEEGGKTDTRGLTEDEIVANSLFFLLAGFDTTSITMTFLAYNLALHQDCQDRLYEEIQDNIGSAKPTYDNVINLQYLDMVVQETLRMYPPASRLNRRTARNVTLKGYNIPKDMMIFIPIWHIHRDPEFWPEPDKFDPERFSPEKKDSFNPYCFLPFGVGPRNCIGMRLATLEVKMAIVAILQKFRLVTTPETEIPPVLEKGGFIRAQNPVKLQAEPR